MADNVSIRGLEFQIVENSSQAISSLERLRSTLERVKSATKGGLSGVGSTAKQIEKLNRALNSVPTNVGKLNALADGMRAIGAVSNVKVSSSFAKQIMLVGDAVKNLQWTDGDKLEALANGLRPLTELGRANLTTFLNQLKKLPDVVRSLDDVDLTAFAAKIEQVARGLRPLADEMAKVSAGFAAFPSRIQRLIASSDQYNNSVNRMDTTTGRFHRTFTAIRWSLMYMGIRRISHAIGYAVTKSNEFTENMNLFTVSMGDYADEALEYGEKVRDALGIDLSDWIRNQGIFNTLLTGFGNTADRAALMSKNLTQLGYDLSSFYNLPVADAMQKLQSGMAGELEPLRRLGYDLSKARLEQEALNQGIEKHYSDMSQAEKAELRYMVIMNSVTEAQGDLARTLDAPANQLRILKSEFTMAAQAIGNIFIPALNAILPYAIAVVKVIREIANAIASLFGFAMPEVDFSGIKSAAGGAGELADNLGSAAGAAKKLQDYTAGFDELNIFNPKKGGGGGGGIGGGGGAGFDFELPDYDFLGDAIQSKVQEILNDIKSTIGLKIKDVFFEWDDLTPQAILEKAITALGAILGGVAGFAMGGVPGAIAGVFTGVALSLLIETLAFDRNGKITGKEVAKLLVATMNTIGGAIIGFSLGGPGGAIMGALVGLGISYRLLSTVFKNGGDLNGEGIISLIVEAMGAIAGGILGFMVGGPGGAAVGASIGLGIAYGIIETTFTPDGKITSNEIVNLIVNAMGVIAGGVLGFMVGGPGGAAIGAAIGLGVAYTILKTTFDEDGRISSSEVVSLIVNVMSVIGGGVIGFMVGGPGGAAIGATVGLGIGLTINGLDASSGGNTNSTDFLNKITAVLTSIMGGVVGFFVGGPAGAAIGATLTVGLNLLLRAGNIRADDVFNEYTHLPGLPAGTKLPSPHRRANGGFVDEGEMFVAREAGPELVGSIGRRTAVANNDQIVESVASGVAVANDGVIAAIYNLINAVENKDMSVNIGDDEIGASYDRYSLNRGVGVNEGAFANAY